MDLSCGENPGRVSSRRPERYAMIPDSFGARVIEETSATTKDPS